MVNKNVEFEPFALEGMPLSDLLDLLWCPPYMVSEEDFPKVHEVWNHMMDWVKVCRPDLASPINQADDYGEAEIMREASRIKMRKEAYSKFQSQLRKPNRIIVAGSRGFNDYALLDRKLTHILQRLTPDDTVIISGCAKGADTMGEHWAWEHRFEVLRFPAQWDVHGLRAGYLRNEEMLKVATHLIAFHDGASRGTAHMIDLARRKGLKVVVVRVV